MVSQFAELYEKNMRDFQEGNLVKGKIVALRGREVIIDISY
jgi:ribosomal protein S1